MVEGVAALEERGFQDNTRTEGEETEETVPARASQVPSPFMAVEEAAVLIMKMLVLGEQVEGVMVLLRAPWMALQTLEVAGVAIITPVQTARAALAS